MKNILRQISPDVVHAQFGPAGVIIAPVATALDVPLVVTLHGYDVTELLRETRWQKAYRSLGDQAAQLLGVSSHICERMVDVGMPEQKVKKFFLGVKLDDFEYQARNSNAKSSSVHCLHVGRLTEKKGPALLLEALHHARKRLDESITLHLSIAGDGQLFDLVESRISELELDETVEMLGAVPHERVVALMRKADLYTQHCVTASSGDQEGLPVSLMEAAAVGLPIVSTRHSGIPDLVTHEETGLLVEERDTEAMGRYIAALARDPERRSAMGRAGRQRVEERFDLKKKIQKLTGVYEDVLSKKTP
jgi:colanic acid/amylovoran biosynthesis glycosyltransferase